MGAAANVCARCELQQRLVMRKSFADIDVDIDLLQSRSPFRLSNSL
jgi:hypothetical protein